MRKIQRLMNMISENLRRYLGAVLVLLFLASTLACTTVEPLVKPVPEKKKVEIWLIDSEDVVLFRRISDQSEEAIPIQNNPQAMDKFMCISREEADYWIEELVE